jgi:hypothetical protein
MAVTSTVPELSIAAAISSSDVDIPDVEIPGEVVAATALKTVSMSTARFTIPDVAVAAPADGPTAALQLGIGVEAAR